MLQADQRITHIALQSLIEKVKRDIDYVVFTSARGEWEPPLGDFLWDFTDEAPVNQITKFVTGGPKNYAYCLAKPNRKGETSICKVPGITLNFKNVIDINFSSLKQLVTGQRALKHVSPDQQDISSILN